MPKGEKPPTNDDYPVGYGRPPENTRFSAGKSGNPGGRPKRQDEVIPVILKVVNEHLPIVENGRRRKMVAEEIMLRGQIKKAIRGDLAATKLLTELKEKAERKKSLNDKDAYDYSVLSDDELEMVDKILSKARRK